MIELHAVVALPASGPGQAWLRLHAGCTDVEVERFVEALVTPLDVDPRGWDETLAGLLGEELLVVSGGLRVLDTDSGTEIVPGCCCGVDDWREWAEVTSGASPWMGHDPWPVVETDGEELHVRQDSDPDRAQHRWAGVEVVPRSLLPLLLRQVHQDLGGFLGILESWLARNGPGPGGAALVELVDRSLAITAPLELSP